MALGFPSIEQSLLLMTCNPFCFNRCCFHLPPLECSKFVHCLISSCWLWGGYKRYPWSQRNEWRSGHSALSGRDAPLEMPGAPRKSRKVWEQTLWIGVKVYRSSLPPLCWSYQGEGIDLEKVLVIYVKLVCNTRYWAMSYSHDCADIVTSLKSPRILQTRWVRVFPTLALKLWRGKGEV